MNKSIWLKDGVSTFPVLQPMVGQHEFYQAYQNFLSDIKEAPMSRIFPLIAKWGIGKSRIGYELISEVLGIDKGWTIRNSDGELQAVRLLREGFEDRILPIYIRYEQMNEDYLYGENWVGYGAYVALSKLAIENPETTIQGSIIKHLQSNLLPLGFSPKRLGEIIEKEQHSPEQLLGDDIQLLDKLVQKGMEYLSQFAIDHLHIIVDEVESEYELFQDGIYENNEERKKKLDGEAIKVITSAIKHEDSRSRHPNVSFLLLCSPAIGDQIKALEALDRRGDKLEMTQNSYADISDYIESLQKQEKIRQYPEGLVEAAYTVAAGNFGWFNVVMAHCDQYLDNHPDAEAGQVLLDLAHSVPRFKDSLIDISQLDYIDSKPIHQPLIKKALLRQLPVPKREYTEQEQQVLLSAKHIEGIPLFKEFIAIPLTKSDLGFYLVSNKYRSDANHLFVNETTGESFSLDVLIRSLETFSINAPENYFIIGKERETFLAQVRTLYPKDEVVDAAEILYSYFEQKEDKVLQGTFIGPNFAFLERLNRRYAAKTGIANYLLLEEKDQELQQLLKERKKDYGKDVERTVLGFIRALEQDYSDTETLKIKGKVCGFRSNVERHIHLGIHPKKMVDVIWASRLEKLNDLAESNLFDIGVHPIFILSSTADTEIDINKFKRDYPLAGRCVIFFQVTNLQKNVLEVLSVDREVMDIRPVAHQLATPFKAKIRALRDEVAKVARAWFEHIDQQGYVLRPLIFTKAEEDNLALLAEGYTKMLIHNATSTELGIKQGIKFTESEKYNRFCQVLKATEVRAKLEKNGYEDAKLFVKTSEDNYEVQVPVTFATLLTYIGNTRRIFKDIQNIFFFSSVDTIKPVKIVEQWIYFLQNLKVLEVQGGTHAQNVMKTTLEFQRDKVQKWRDEEYDKLVDEFKQTIDKNRLGILKDDKFRGRLDVINEALKEINLSSLQVDTVNPLDTWKEQLKLLKTFHTECNFIYDEEQWNSLQFNERMISNLNISDQDMPIWKKLRLVQLFHDYISTLQKNILAKLKHKLESIRANSSYQDYVLPISPFTNALERYQTEIEYAKDYIKSSKRETMVTQSDSLAHHLWLAKYKEAIERLNTMIGEIGLEKEGQNQVDWKDHSGISGRYDVLFEKFKQMVDYFVENQLIVQKWLSYFTSAPAEVKQRVQSDQLETNYNEIQMFLEAGFDEQIDDYHLAQKGHPIQLIEYSEQLLQEQKNKITSLIATLQQIEISMRKIRDEYYDHDLINTVNLIYRVQHKSPYQPEVGTAIQENSYENTIENVRSKMEQLDEEGRQFFTDRNAQFVRFEFFKDVVKSKADIDWNSYPREKEELENFSLIKIKVVLL
ncbi:hypothetical protein COD05_06165 [Bacillus cereus]|uniref:hypothetical protein n=1 Tax=Bacillus sp. AW TaxID=2293329 RepID=UPI000BF6937A|nr:hypothetical protein COJ53_07095 [Bacillus cereus]PGP32390.1 hypothetical protein CN989_28150 [Bacillus cereus]PGT11583.1 hypothetical protein COD05_06165 [Bacillus cereus]RFB76209.1 hypothetical protein DZB94_08940 [Bacillus sp. AW]